MKKRLVEVGRTYLARVNGKVVPVLVEDFWESAVSYRAPPAPRWGVLNKITGRRTVFYSSAKFLSAYEEGE